MLDDAGIKAWPGGGAPELSEGVSVGLNFYPACPKMNKPVYNEPDCIEPLAAA